MLQIRAKTRELLFKIAEDESISIATRADAIGGLSLATGDDIPRLIELAKSADRSLREESLRSLRYCQLDNQQRQQLIEIANRQPDSLDLINAAMQPTEIAKDRPPITETTAWQMRLDQIQQPVDLDAGRRIFHHAQVGTCSKCHRHLGRGSVVGPDLSAMSDAGSPHRILRSILQPSLEVDPQFFPRMLITDDGHVFTGIMLRDGGGGNEVYRDNTGRERVFKTAQIVGRKPLTTSMMPEGLVDTMTDRELRDLIAFMNATPNRVPGKSKKDKALSGTFTRRRSLSWNMVPRFQRWLWWLG